MCCHDGSCSRCVKQRAYEVQQALIAVKTMEDVLFAKCQNEFGTHGAKLLGDVIRRVLNSPRLR